MQKYIQYEANVVWKTQYNICSEKLRRSFFFSSTDDYWFQWHERFSIRTNTFILTIYDMIENKKLKFNSKCWRCCKCMLTAIILLFFFSQRFFYSNQMIQKNSKIDYSHTDIKFCAADTILYEIDWIQI